MAENSDKQWPRTLQDYFDFARKAVAKGASKDNSFSIEDSRKDGYVIEKNEGDRYKEDIRNYGEKYYAYVSNETWKDKKKDIIDHFEKCGKCPYKGGGNEMEPRYYKRDGIIKKLPPKMASYGSSSMFIYDLLKGTDGFMPEKALHTGFGERSYAHLDGSFEDKNIFIEAKCREIYSSAANKFSIKYKPLIEKELKDFVEFEFLPKKTKKEDALKIWWKGENGRESLSFDLKQMICHLCGIARRQLGMRPKSNEISIGKVSYAPVRFIYLVYNPEELYGLLEQQDVEIQREIKEKYENEIEIANDTIGAEGFRDIYQAILKYFIKSGQGIKLDEMVNNFSFEVCGQDNLLDTLRKYGVKTSD